MGLSKDKQLHTLECAISAMQEKIESQISVFENSPLAQSVTVGTGEEILRQNPYVSEFRALVKDYTQIVKAYKEMGGSQDAEIKSLDSIRSKFKVAK
jgi:hypothetical protein